MCLVIESKPDRSVVMLTYYAGAHYSHTFARKDTKANRDSSQRTPLNLRLSFFICLDLIIIIIIIVKKKMANLKRFAKKVSKE